MNTRSLAQLALVIATVLGSMTSATPSEACPKAAAEIGAVRRMTATEMLVDDQRSPMACGGSTSAGCTAPRYRGFLRVLGVRIDEVERTGAESTWVDERARFVLKDAAGTVIAEQPARIMLLASSVPVIGADFDVLGATACVRTSARADPDADAGSLGGDGGVSAESEVCVPVTATSLEPTDADRAAHEASVTEACSTAQAFTAPGVGTNRESGESGCSVVPGPGASAHGGLLGLALALGSAAVRRSRTRRARR